MTHEYGYSFPETDIEKSCFECGCYSLVAWCDRCEDPICEDHLALRGKQTLCISCDEVAEQAEIDNLWGHMIERCNDHPAGIVHMAWAHSQNQRDISTPEHAAAVVIFKRAIKEIWDKEFDSFEAA